MLRVVTLVACIASATLVGCSRSDGATDEPLRYVAFGDSLAAWETLHGFGYTKSFKEALASDRKMAVTEKNFGHAGDYSDDMLAILRQAASLEAVRTADVVTWNAGTNDFLNARYEYRTGICGGADNQDCLRRAVASFRENWDAIVETLRSAPHKSDAVFLTMTLFYPEGAESDASYTVTSSYLDQMNAHIRTSSGVAGVADVRALFNGTDGRDAPQAPRADAPDGLVEDDGHPNAVGVALIADALRALAAVSTASE